MKLKYLALLCLPLGLAACQTPTTKPVETTPVTETQTPVQLTDYVWQYQTDLSNVPVTLTLHPNANKRLSVQTGCNQLNGTWDSNTSQLKTLIAAGTMKACSPQLMQQEQWANKFFSQATFNYQTSAQNPEQPILRLVNPQGQAFDFTGKKTPEAKYQSEGEIIFLEIAPETKSCTGVVPQQCLQVREIKYDNGKKIQVDKDWTYFYDQIENFKHDSNLRQIVRVKRYEIKNHEQIADGSKYAYVLDLIVESEQIK